MFSHQLYNLVHILGIVLVVMSLAGAAVLVRTGGTQETASMRRMLAILHGAGAFMVLLGGFGMLARLGITQGGFPGWIWVKLGIWLLVAAALFLPYRRPSAARALILAIPVLVGIAAYMALYKPI